MSQETYTLRGGRGHSVTIEGRERTTVSGVLDVESFHDEEVICQTEVGVLAFAGQDLHIVKLDLAEGQLILEGMILGANYLMDRGPKGGVLKKLFK